MASRVNATANWRIIMKLTRAICLRCSSHVEAVDLYDCRQITPDAVRDLAEACEDRPRSLRILNYFAAADDLVCRAAPSFMPVSVQCRNITRPVCHQQAAGSGDGGMAYARMRWAGRRSCQCRCAIM
jgi:hypothetical protein